MKTNLKITFVFMICSLIGVSGFNSSLEAGPVKNSRDILKVGKKMPDAMLENHVQDKVGLKSLLGKVKIISVVPKLNTPVCDKQTHKLSEENGGLDQYIDIVTISTNSAEGQKEFAQNAKINNLIFLSDKPSYEFGKTTGLLMENMNMLRRTILVLNSDNVIKYVDFVPRGGLPDIEKALEEAKKVLEEEKMNNHNNPKT
jgi:thiol peroxidase